MGLGTLTIIDTISQVGLFLATVGLVYIAYYQVNKIREQSNADFIARLNWEFFYENAINPSNRRTPTNTTEKQGRVQRLRHPCVSALF
jgi:hypothetical protein